MSFENENMKVGYARVSTQDQNPDLQIHALKEAGCEKIFIEKVSGIAKQRPELQSALNYMRAGDTLVVWRMDRLARSLSQLIETVESLEEQKIGFCSLNESIDTTTAGGKLIFHIFGSLSEFERSIIKERTKAGLEVARKQGRVGGRKPKLKPEDIESMKTLLANPKFSVKDIAERHGISIATLYRYIPNARSCY